MKIPKKWLKFVALGLVSIGLLGLIYWWLMRSTTGEVSILCYTGYDEAEVVEAFRKATGIQVKAKTYFGGDQMFNLLSKSGSEYDVVVVDPEYIEKLATLDRLEPLNREDFKDELRNYYKNFQDLPECSHKGRLYGIPVRFGFNALVYNADKVAQKDAQSYQCIWKDEYKGKVGLVDWYLLSMGAISKAMGHAEPYDLTDKEFAALVQKTRELKPRLSAIYSIPEMFNAFARGETWILPCGGESVVYELRDQGNFEWIVPKEGGILWVETLAIPKDARRKDAAKKFIAWAQTPEAQALLATRKAYASSVPNKKAYSLLSERDRAILKTDSEASVESLLSNVKLRRLPSKQTPEQWQKEWERIKAQ